MKKTMFITSVIMVVVLAIALTTSSLAWFTAGGATSVGTTTLNIKAKEAAAAGAGLQISHDGNAFQTTAISLNNAAVDGYNPMCPVGTRSGENSSFTHAEFYAALGNMYTNLTVQETREGALTEVFKGTPTHTNIAAYSDTFYVRNSGGTATNVEVVINIEADAVDTDPAVLWVAVFDTTTSGSPVLLALNNNNSRSSDKMTYAWGADQDAALAKLANGALASNIYGASNGVAIADFNATSVISLPAGQQQGDAWEDGAAHQFTVFAWYDGEYLTNLNSDSSDAFTVTVRIPESGNNNG